jgi:hypothetical protein
MDENPHLGLPQPSPDSSGFSLQMVSSNFSPPPYFSCFSPLSDPPIANTFSPLREVFPITFSPLPPLPATEEFGCFSLPSDFTESLFADEARLEKLIQSLDKENVRLYAETSLLKAIQQAVPSESRDNFIAQTKQKITTIKLEIGRIESLISDIEDNNFVTSRLF